MEPKGSLPHSQERSTDHVLSQTSAVLIIPYYLSKIHPNIIHPPTPWSSNGLFPCDLPTNNINAFRFSPLLLHAVPILSHSTWSLYE
jgi:hypothetical protein